MRWGQRTAALLGALLGVNAAVADECDEKGLKVADAIQAKFERRTKAGVLFFNKEGVGELTVKCGYIKKGNIDLFFGYQTPYPRAADLALLYKAASAGLDMPETSIRAAADLCHRTALKSSTELAEITRKGVEMTCQAFTRDGGAANFKVWRTKKGPLDE